MEVNGFSNCSNEDVRKWKFREMPTLLIKSFFTQNTDYIKCVYDSEMIKEYRGPLIMDRCELINEYSGLLKRYMTNHVKPILEGSPLDLWGNGYKLLNINLYVPVLG